LSAILTVQNVEKSFGTRRLLAGVSFAVHERDRVALVGLNGSGKSTLLRMMVSPGSTDPAASPDAGQITIKRGLRVEYVPQEPRLDGALSVGETLRQGQRAYAAALARLDAIAGELAAAAHDDERHAAALAEQAQLHEQLAHGGWDQDHEVQSLAAALELERLDAVVGTLSGGERRRVALGRALLGRPELLALDEPTNHLDTRTIEWLEERLRQHPGALLLVTHDRYFLDRVATRIVELDRGRLYAYDGGYARFLEQQADRLADETAREAARASFVRRELDWIRRGPKARGTKQQARIDRFDQAVAAKPQAEDRRAGPMTLRLPTGGRLGKTILELDGVGKSLGGKRLFGELTLLLKPGDRIGVVGPNGAGKTTLVRTILGLESPDEGEVRVGQNTRFAFLDQARAELRDDRTVLDEVAGGDNHVFLDDGPVHVRTFLRMLLFDDGFADTPVGALSGGERNRVQLAKLLRRGGNFLVLDEPTNDLDLVTLGVLEEALVEFPGCALVVSHDRWFLDRVATGILAFEGAGRVTFYEGDYSSYLARRPTKDAPPAPAPVRKPERAKPAAARKLTFKERQELDGIEAAILAAESRAAELQTTLADPALYKTRAAEVPALVAALDAARAEIDRLYARWQELDALAR
jgi:ATP-binding cassette subfamily F protein uup